MNTYRAQDIELIGGWTRHFVKPMTSFWLWPLQKDGDGASGLFSLIHTPSVLAWTLRIAESALMALKY